MPQPDAVRSGASADGEFGLAVAVAQKAVVTYMLKAAGKHIEQKAADKFRGFHSHGALRGAAFVVLPGKRDSTAFDV